jgi:hypothetical protein
MWKVNSTCDECCTSIECTNWFFKDWIGVYEECRATKMLGARSVQTPIEKPCERFEALKDLGWSSSESRELSPSQWAIKKASEINLNYEVKSTKSSHVVFQCIEERWVRSKFFYSELFLVCFVQGILEIYLLLWWKTLQRPWSIKWPPSWSSLGTGATHESWRNSSRANHGS